MSSGEARRRRLALAAAAHAGCVADLVALVGRRPAACDMHILSKFSNYKNEHHQCGFCDSGVHGYNYCVTCFPDGKPTLAPTLCATPPWVARASASMQQGRHHCTRSLLESRRRSVALLASPIASRRRCNATPPHRLHGRHRLHGGGSEGTGLELLRVCQDVGRALGRACVLARWPPRRLGPEEGAGRACMHGGVRRSAAK